MCGGCRGRAEHPDRKVMRPQIRNQFECEGRSAGNRLPDRQSPSGWRSVVSPFKKQNVTRDQPGKGKRALVRKQRQRVEAQREDPIAHRRPGAADHEIECSQLQRRGQQVPDRRGKRYRLRVYRHHAEQQRCQQRSGAFADNDLADLEDKKNYQQVQRDHRGVPAGGIQAEQMIAQAKPDVLQRAIVRALRLVNRVAKPPHVAGQRLPEKRPLPDITVIDDLGPVVEDKSVAQRSQV